MTRAQEEPPKPDPRHEADPPDAASAMGDLRGVPMATFLTYFLGSGTWGFGGPIATVGYMQRDLVERRGWPVVITATFVGYLAAGWLGALVATVAIFTPIFLGVVVPGPWFIRHRDNRQIQAFVKGATAAAAGATAGAVIVLSTQTITDWPSAAIAVATLAILLRWKVKEPYVVAAGAIAGIAMHWAW